jgi:hypothetical protein
LTEPLGRLGRDGDQFQVVDELTDRARELVPEDNAGEREARTLPALGEGEEADVLRKQDAPELAGALEHLFVRPIAVAVVGRGQHVNAAAAQLLGDGFGDVYVHVQADRHSQQPLGPHPEQKRGGVGGGVVEAHLFPFRLDLGVDLRLVVEVVPECGVDLGGGEGAVLAANLVRRPPVRQVVHCNLGHADARQCVYP